MRLLRFRARFGWRGAVLVVGALLAVAAAAALLSREISWHRAVLLGAAAFSPYVALAGSVLALAAFGVSRSWIGLAVAAVLLACTVVAEAPEFVASAGPGGAAVTVMTANLHMGGADPAAVVAAVRDRSVALLMLEELTPAEADALRRAGLDALLPHAIVDARPDAAGTGLWSRYPRTARVERSDFTFAFVTAQAALPQAGNAPVQLAALHMCGPYPDAGSWVRDIDHLPSVLDAFPAGMPALVGGDFNATPDTAQFRRLLTDGYADAADQAGAGWTPTYPADRGPFPLITIDHVLTRHAVAVSAEALSIPGTDHRALVTVVRFPHP